MISAPLARAASTNFFTFGTEAAQRGRRACVQVCTVKSMTRSAVVLASSVTGLSCGGAGSFALDQSSMIVVSASAGSAAAPANAAATETKAPSKIDLRNTCSSPVSHHLTSPRCRRKAACPVLSSQRPNRYACGQKTRPRALMFARSGPTSKARHQIREHPSWPLTRTSKPSTTPSIAAPFSAPPRQALSDYPTWRLPTRIASRWLICRTKRAGERNHCRFYHRLDLKNAPPLAIERSRTAFVDAIGTRQILSEWIGEVADDRGTD